MRPFNACSLCLERARTPLACSEGHLFCIECVFTDLGASVAFACPHELLAGALDPSTLMLSSHTEP